MIMMKTTIIFKKKFMSQLELHEEGLSYYKTQKMVQEGILKKASKSQYEVIDYKQSFNDYSYIKPYVKEGIVCLLSAASIYGLVTHQPIHLDLAVPNKSRYLNLPDWPKMQLYYFTKHRYEIGIVSILIEGVNVSIYDIEKTVCDLVSYRTKLGTDIAIEALKNYLNTNNSNINKLIAYAKELRCERIMTQYLEVILN